MVLFDVAAEMAAVAARRAGANPRVSTAVFDQSAIGFADASFDAVINRPGLMFVEDPRDDLATVARRVATKYKISTAVTADTPTIICGAPFTPPHD